MSGVCYIVGAGDWYDHTITVESGDFLIAADGGYKYVQKLGISCDLLMGDFDSFEHEVKGENVLRFPPKKDDTDTLLACKHGLNLGYKTFHIYGGMGGRFDHTIANLQTLSYLSKEGAIGYLHGDGQITTLITNSSYTWDSTNVGYVSVFSYGETAKNVTIKGLKYEVSNANLNNTMPIGVSNEFTGKEAFVSVEVGSLLLVWEAQ